MKLDLMDEQCFGEKLEATEEYCAAYLRLAIVEVEHQWRLQWGDPYQSFEIVWEINVGIPAGAIDESEVVCRFERVAELAVSRLPHATFGSLTSVNVVPEVAAQVATYAKSPLRREGLHFIVDVGAATVDTAAFILKQNAEGDDVYSLLSTSVEKLGAYRLHCARIDAIEASGGAVTPGFRSTVHQVPNDVASYLSDGSAGHRVLDGVDTKFHAFTKRSMHQVLHHVRKYMYPNAPAWAIGARFFVCGGGSAVSVYQKANRALSIWWHENGREIAPFEFQGILPPTNLRWSSGPPQPEFHRLSVAYGLSFPFVEVGRVRSPGEIAPVEAPERVISQFAYEDSKDLT
ncbi:MAG: hypothetical protein JJ896_03400 [Rhodothermales bacterium]|nr:hypothetical protein [Rhodothermales bacterium]MBO6778680.1 hypothetical protein [Rhodothermales bacterium]